MNEWISSEKYAEWDRFVDAQSFATCFHLSAWNRIAKKAYGIESRIFVTRDPRTGAINGGLPLFYVRRPFSHYVTSGAFGSYGPILCAGAEDQRTLIDAAIHYTRQTQAKYLILKTMDTPESRIFPPILHERLERRDIWVTATLPLSMGPDALWKSFTSSMRAKVRKATHHGLSVRFSRGLSELEVFYDILSENMLRKGFPIYGIAFMKETLTEFGDRAQIVTVWKGDESVSGAIVLEYKGAVYVPFVSSRKRFFPLRPNNLLYWEIMRHYAERGASFLDFGTSLKGASTLGFKTSWGSQAYALPSYIYSPRHEEIRLDPSQFGVALGVSILKSLPRRVADRIGPHLSKFML